MKTLGRVGIALVKGIICCQGIIIFIRATTGLESHLSQQPASPGFQEPEAAPWKRLWNENTRSPSWDCFVWIGMAMSAQAPAWEDCLDNFWALQRANRSRSHWRQWKNSSSLQRALDPAHTAAMSDRESGINSSSTEKTDLPPKVEDSGNQH